MIEWERRGEKKRYPISKDPFEGFLDLLPHSYDEETLEKIGKLSGEELLELFEKARNQALLDLPKHKIRKLYREKDRVKNERDTRIILLVFSLLGWLSFRFMLSAKLSLLSPFLQFVPSLILLFFSLKIGKYEERSYGIQRKINEIKHDEGIIERTRNGRKELVNIRTVIEGKDRFIWTDELLGFTFFHFNFLLLEAIGELEKLKHHDLMYLPMIEEPSRVMVPKGKRQLHIEESPTKTEFKFESPNENEEKEG